MSNNSLHALKCFIKLVRTWSLIKAKPSKLIASAQYATLDVAAIGVGLDRVVSLLIRMSEGVLRTKTFFFAYNRISSRLTEFQTLKVCILPAMKTD